MCQTSLSTGCRILSFARLIVAVISIKNLDLLHPHAIYSRFLLCHTINSDYKKYAVGTRQMIRLMNELVVLLLNNKNNLFYYLNFINKQLCDLKVID